jgi:hypothetical protein
MQISENTPSGFWPNSQLKAQLEVDTVSLTGSDYDLGKGEFASSEDEFEEAREGFLRAVTVVIPES